MFDKYKRKRKKIKNVTYRDIDMSVPDFFNGDDLNNNSITLKLSAVFACVNIISNSIAKMPLFVVNSKTNKHIDEDPVYKLLNRKPNSYLNPFNMKKLTEIWVLMEGNAYWYKVYDGKGQLVELLPIHPNYVSIVQNSEQIFYDVSLPNRQTKRLFPEEIIHFKELSFDGINGESVLSYAAQTTEMGLVYERYQKSFYKKGGRPEGTLQVDSDLSEENINKMKKEWEKAHSGPDNAFRIAVLTNGIKYSSVPQISQKDAAFIESKEVNIADIARFFQVPLYKLNAGTQSYNSNEQNSIEYLTSSLSPRIANIEDELTLKLLTEKQWDDGLRIKANMNVELRGDTAARGAWYRTMREIGAYSVNDIRSYEDLEDVIGGDTRQASLNYIPLEMFEELSKARNGGNKA